MWLTQVLSLALQIVLLIPPRVIPECKACDLIDYHVQIPNMIHSTSQILGWAISKLRSAVTMKQITIFLLVMWLGYVSALYPVIFRAYS